MGIGLVRRVRYFGPVMSRDYQRLIVA